MRNSNLKELYEVFRVEEGVALFLEDHLERLFLGARKAGISMDMDFFDVMEYVEHLLTASENREGNVRLSFYFDGEDRNIVSHEGRFIPHHYPSKEMYKNGVACVLMNAERENPGAKIAETGYRERANELIAQNDVFEALLTDRHNKITEGSRSNVFFIINNELITAPEHLVLPGVVRKKTLALAKSNNIPVTYRCIEAEEELAKTDACFLTGTSPRILPVSRIGNTEWPAVHPLTEKLIHDFHEMIHKYICDHKKTS
ncbi:MAG: aminotransferase class IV [Marinilabiliaceae bacterium]